MKAKRKILSIWLPALAIERWAKLSGGAPDQAIVLTVEGAHGPVIHAVTAAAAARGAHAGMRLTDARALDPALAAVPADVAGDAALVARLARWAQRWSPLVEIDGGDPSTSLGTGALRLDISGGAHLFGGEAGLAADVVARFAALGLSARTAIAATAGAAWALARYAPSALEGEGLSAILAPLPVAALRLSPQATRTLERLGLKTIGTLAGIERRSLARRFREADNPLDALDRMLGRKDEPLTAAPFTLPPRALLRLEEPAVHVEAGAQALERLIPRLVAELQARQLGARRLALSGYRVDGSVAVASVATAIPSRDGAHLQRLLAEKAAALDPEFGFDAFALEASWSEPLGAAQDSLVESVNAEADVARLVDRLSVKLGADKVRRPKRHESHVPERASGWVAAVSSSPRFRGEGDRSTKSRGGGVSSSAQNPSTMLRPSAPPAASLGTGMVPLPSKSWGGIKPQRLLDQPEAIAVVYATPEGLPRRFMWRRAVHDIARVEGPERIAPEWWREAGNARLRDYYRVEDQAGRRYWIFRSGVIGDGRGGAPGWFIHGLFG